MGLNIKNERVHALAREAARITGTTQTGAIEKALELLLRTHDADPETVRITRTVDMVHTLVLEYASDPGDEGRQIRTVEDLYDEATGLPR